MTALDRLVGEQVDVALLDGSTVTGRLAQMNTYPKEIPMPTTVTANRHAKARLLADAFEHLAAPSTDVPATPAEVLTFAEQATDYSWRRVEALAGVRSASSETRAVVLSLLFGRVDDGAEFNRCSR